MLMRVTPGAAAKAYHAGSTAEQFFAEVEAAGRHLALLDLKAERVLNSVAEYEKLSSSACRKLPGKVVADDRLARSRLNCAIVLLLNRAFRGLLEDESRAMRRLAEAEAGSGSEQDLASNFRALLTDHFAASQVAVFRGRGKAQLARIRHIAPGSALALNPEWKRKPAAIWSVPVEELVVQMAFADKRPLLPRESQLLETIATRWRTALVRLRREERLRGISLRILEVEELERRRISRELHDDAGQALVVIRLQLEMAEFAVPKDNHQVREQLAEMRVLTERTILSVRKLISDLSPAVLEQLGMAAAVRQLVNRFRASQSARVRLHIGKLPRLNPRLELVLYRVLQECFTNISRHSAATHINVSLTSSDGEVRLIVEDNGIGFNVEEGLGRRNCYGLIGIRERVRLLGGRFSVESTPDGVASQYHSNGTFVMIQLPLTGENPGRPEQNR